MAAKPAKKGAKRPAVKKSMAKKGSAKKAAPKKAAKAKAPARKPAKAPAKAPARKAAATSEKPAKVRAASKPKNPSGSYTQGEFLENIRAFCGLTKRSEAKELVEDISSLITDTLKRGYKIPFFGLGKMYVRNTKERMGRNPATKEEILIPAKKRVRFAPSKALKESVL